MYVDSHCHLDFPEFAAELPALLDAMAAARVTHALCIGVNLPDWPAVHALAMAHPNLYATVGVHPDAEDTPEPTVDDARRARRAAQGRRDRRDGARLLPARRATSAGSASASACTSARRCARESRW